MLEDLGANSIYDVMAFAPNTDPFIMATSDITGNGNDFINIFPHNQYCLKYGGHHDDVGQAQSEGAVPQLRFD